MRHRLLAVALASALVPLASGSAQEARSFRNSWFWGIHGGAATIGTPGQASSSRGTIGADWLITRTMGGVYAAYDQTNFTGVSSVPDPSAASGTRLVDIRDMRTVSLGAVAFPLHVGGFRPYGGLGFALSVVGSASARPDTAGGSVPSGASRAVEDARSRSTIFALGGAQWQVGRVAVYGQVTLFPPSDSYLVSRQVTMFAAGVRLNVGRSVSR